MMQPEIVDNLKVVEWVGDVKASDKVLLYHIHDGAQVPRQLFGDRTEEVFGRPEIAHAYYSERDWGADLVTRELARQLGLGGYLRINLARVVMDYGRLPGSSGTATKHLLRYCFFPPLVDVIPEEMKYALLERYYDPISRQIALHAENKKITIAVHTYDPHNESGTLRPELSILSRLLEYSAESTLPPDIFDPLCPPGLCEEATTHRALTYNILQKLERGGHQTAINYPYLMPAGSTEMRGQVWYFFRHLRRHFTQAHPETRDETAYRLVWLMLHDVDHRSADAARLRGFLHRYHGAPDNQRKLFLAAREAYARIKTFLEENYKKLYLDYRDSSERSSSLGLEVRKDLLFHLDPENGEVRLRDDAELTAYDIAFRIAEACHSFLEEEELMAGVLDNLGVRQGFAS